MDEYRKAILDLSKSCITEYVRTPGRMVTSKPCFVFNLIVNPSDAENVTQVYIRNGESSASEALIGLTAQYAHATHIGHFPIYFNRGLYVETPTNVKGVTVQYLVDSP